MNDKILRHLVSGIATFICLLAYSAGYISGGYGWWWTGFAMLIVYGIIFKVIDGDHH